MLLELDWVRICDQTLQSEVKQGLHEGVKSVSASKRLEQKLADDSTFAIRQDFERLQSLLNDLSVYSDGAFSLSKVCLAIKHEVVESVEQVAELALCLGHHFWEEVKDLPHKRANSLLLSDKAFDQEQNFVFEVDLRWL